MTRPPRATESAAQSPSTSKKRTWRTDFVRDLIVTFIGTFVAFSLAVWWDGHQRRRDRREDIQNAANVFYSQTQTNYRRLTRANAVLRNEMARVPRGDPHLLDASPLVELQETTDELLVRLAPSVKGDVGLMDRILTVARESNVINSQIRWRDNLRARLQTRRDLLSLFRSDSLLLANDRLLMGIIESPDTLWQRRFRIAPFE